MKRTLKEDPAYYPADRGNNDDDESSNDDDDDDDVEKDKEDKEEKEEHPAPTDPSDVSTDDLETMTTVNQGMNVKEIERVVAQRVANAIEAIAIYETKTNLAHKSMSQTERQEEEVAENASNKRKWEGNHNGSLSQQNKGHEVSRAHTAWLINKKAYAGSLPLCNQCKFHHNETCLVKCGDFKKWAVHRKVRKLQAEVTLQGIGRRNITANLSRCVLNATITMMVHVLPNATSAADLAI
nr:reverse transcriptase domain-containing protein [Tanacetum cinerariifolium]